ncbi:MAG: inositol monophosphatase [Rhodospirillales bacterium]|nr:inositol monophosphatase [Rhodospirillales bacterium]
MSFSIAHVEQLAAILRTAARAEILPRFRHLDPSAIHQKTGPLDLVTEADLAAEAAITRALGELYPGAHVLGEEAVAAEPRLLQRLGGRDLCFVVDPVDGTANFAAGIAMFAVMIAAIENGRVLAAAIHDPLADDTACALAGGGAWLLGGRGRIPLAVAAPVSLADMAGTVSWRYLPEAMRARFCAGLPRLGGAWDYRCAGQQYRMGASGALHFLQFYRLMPWDHAPGVLLFTEAGGVAEAFDATPYSPRRQDGGLICAPDAASIAALRAALLD